MRRFISLIAICMALYAERGVAETDTHIERPKHETALIEAVADRLALMPEVAKYKWLNDLPIERPEREAELIEQIGERVEASLRAAAERAVRAQIEASKAMQRRLFAGWQTQAAPVSAESLATSRQRIDQATQGLLKALSDYQNATPAGYCRRAEVEVPAALAAFPDAWWIAIDGVLAARCQARNEPYEPPR